MTRKETETRTKPKDPALVANLLSDYLKTLTSISAALITALVGIYSFSPRVSIVVRSFVLYSAVSYLIVVIAGIIAYGALISSVHNTNDPYYNKVIVAFALIQWIAFVAGTFLLVLTLRLFLVDPL